MMSMLFYIALCMLLSVRFFFFGWIGCCRNVHYYYYYVELDVFWKSHPPVIIITINNSLTAKVVGAPHMISQPVSSLFPCSPLPPGTCRTPGLSSPWCCRPTSSSVCFVFSSLSLCLARWFWPDLMNGRQDHTTEVCVSLGWSGSLRLVRLLAGSWHGLPRW